MVLCLTVPAVRCRDSDAPPFNCVVLQHNGILNRSRSRPGNYASAQGSLVLNCWVLWKKKIQHEESVWRGKDLQKGCVQRSQCWQHSSALGPTLRAIIAIKKGGFFKGCHGDSLMVINLWPVSNLADPGSHPDRYNVQGNQEQKCWGQTTFVLPYNEVQNQ